MGFVLGQTVYCNSKGVWNEPELLGVGKRLNSVDMHRIVEGVVILFKLQNICIYNILKYVSLHNRTNCKTTPVVILVAL